MYSTVHRQCQITGKPSRVDMSTGASTCILLTKQSLILRQVYTPVSCKCSSELHVKYNSHVMTTVAVAGPMLISSSQGYFTFFDELISSLMPLISSQITLLEFTTFTQVTLEDHSSPVNNILVQEQP